MDICVFNLNQYYNQVFLKKFPESFPTRNYLPKIWRNSSTSSYLYLLLEGFFIPHFTSISFRLALSLIFCICCSIFSKLLKYSFDCARAFNYSYYLISSSVFVGGNFLFKMPLFIKSYSEIFPKGLLSSSLESLSGCD